MEKIAVIGAGAWGTTLANLIAEKGIPVHLWAKEQELVNDINSKQENTFFLKDKKLSKHITASNSIQEVIADCGFIITAVPSQYLRSVVKSFAPFLTVNKPIIVDLAKGIEHNTLKRMSEILDEEIPGEKTIVALSGPNHAEEVSRKMPTATVAASEDESSLKKVVEILSTDYFKVFPHNDIIGVEICAALKNIAAIATGVSTGIGYGDNGAASIITLALAEMSRVGRFFGAKRATCYGLAGVGDLVATCMSKHSRNRYVGTEIAKGKTFDQIKIEMKGQVAEGVYTAKSVYELSKKQNIELPLTTQVYKVLYENKDIKKAISDLIYTAT